MEKFEKDPSLSNYVKPLNEIILTRLLQQLSQVYSEIKISSVCKLTSNFDRFQIEKFVMNGCRRGEFLIRIDQQKQSLCFEKCVFREKVERTSSFPVDDMLSKLDKFAKSLEVACGRIDPFVSMKREKANLNAFKLAAENADLDRQTTVERRFMIEQKLEQKQEELNALEQNRQAKAYELQVLEEQRLAQQEKVLAVERMNTQRKEIERSEALKLAEKIAAELREKNVKIKDDEITDTDKLIELQVQQLEKEKRILAQKSHTITKLLDHQIRAFRIEEIPLLEQDYLKQCVEDEKVWNQRVKLAKETNEVKEELNRKMLERFEEIRDDYEEYKQMILQESEEKYEQLVKEAEEKIEQEKKQRIEDYEREQAEEEERRIQYEKGIIKLTRTRRIKIDQGKERQNSKRKGFGKRPTESKVG
jgi:translation initiation factor 3 subunit A